MRTQLKHLIKTLVLTLPLCAATSYAESGLYIGGSFGNAKVGFDSPSDEFDIEDDDIGYKVFGGIKFTLLAAEVGYVDFGKIEDSGYSGELSGFNAFGVLSMGLGPVSVFGKLGGFVWESELEAASQKYEEDGFDPAIGVGASFTLGSLGIRGEYEYYDIDGFDEVSMLSLGATYWLF